ncbi:MAG TPA: peptidyl-prolyl cis-trans isomerase [Pyrinomonadaceae bacterium]|nr:peptidyl-prolyl cis-trans isomerase [Pyrinomonadaceae bacterium]
MKLKIAQARARARTFVLAALAVSAFSVSPALAQEEGVPVVLDEPIVQVNNSVIMLSTLKRENAEFKNVLMKQRQMTEPEADAEIAKKQTEIIINLINEALLMERGKDIPRLTEEVEAEVNREVLRVGNGAGAKTIEELDAAMRAEGMSLSDIRETLRMQFMRQAVLSREVDAKIYFGLSTDELKKYYDAHRDKFQGVTLSEIFLSLAGRPEADVLAKAKQLVAQARGGSDFATLAVTHSEREVKGERTAPKSKGLIADEDGKARRFLIADLHAEIGNAVKNVKAGGITEPIKVDEGYLILRVNERDDAFNENQVRSIIMQERGDKERADYLRTLRREAYIKVADNYKDLVQPVLDKDAPATVSKEATPAKDAKGKKQ